MKTEQFLDIIFCIFVLPGMMFLFPTGEWAQWHTGPVLLVIAWLYGVWALCRYLLGRQLLSGRHGVWTAIGALFVATAVTFLLSMARVDFPRDAEQLSGLELHQRAIWLLYLTAALHGLSVGILSEQLRRLSASRESDQAETAARTSLERVVSEAVSGETLTLKVDYKAVQVPLSEIQYIESRNNYACVHLDNRPDVVSQVTLKALLDMLPEGKFIRIHRSYIVPSYPTRFP